MPDGGSGTLNLTLQPKQWKAFMSPANEILYGGAAFGGKSHLARVAAILWCLDVPGLNVYIFRRVEEDLLKNHMEGPSGFRNLLAPLVLSGHCKIVETEIRWYNGSRIFLSHCKDENHRFKYHGSEIHVLIIDELTTFTEVIYRYLRFRVRAVGLKDKMPAKYLAGNVGPHGEVNPVDWFPRILVCSNPGNVGHGWVKRTFLAIDAPTEIHVTPDEEGAMHRVFVPARMEDNQIGMDEDPAYRRRLRGLGDPALVRAMEEGDWNILAGAFFSEFSMERHILKARTLPPQVFTRHFRAVDWGSYRPFSVGWYAIADEDWVGEGMLGNEIVVPRGALVRYREWYGAKQGMDNVGVKMTVDTWAAGVLSRDTPGVDYLHTVCDPSMFKEDGGPSLAERAELVRLNGRHLKMRPGDNQRVVGWDQVRYRLQGDHPEDDGDPMLFLMDNQPDAIRTLESLQHDETKPEDVDTDQEDHAGDEIRYACMSRPRARMRPEDRPPPSGPKPWTVEWLVRQQYHETRPAEVHRYDIEREQ